MSSAEEQTLQLWVHLRWSDLATIEPDLSKISLETECRRWLFPLVSCTIATMESKHRKRLAQAVIARRTELGMLTTKALADRAKLSPRMLGDVENSRRDNFSPGAKAQIERALRWDPGSIDSVLSGGAAFVSGAIRDRSGRPLSQWKAVEGADQEELELYRLAYIVMDARDLVRSQKGPLKNAVLTLLDEAIELVLRRVARWRIGSEEVDAKSLSDARWFINETRDATDIRRQGNIYVIDDGEGADPLADAFAGLRAIGEHVKADPEGLGLRTATVADSPDARLDIERDQSDRQSQKVDTAAPTTAPSDRGLHFERRHEVESDAANRIGAERQLVDEAMLGHYIEMYLRALEQKSRRQLVDQARHVLDDTDPNLLIAAEIDDDLYVRYLAARHSTPYQGGSSKLHATNGLAKDQFDAAHARYLRERSEMILFDGRIRTSGAAVDHIANAIHRATPDAYNEQGDDGDDGPSDPRNR